MQNNTISNVLSIKIISELFYFILMLSLKCSGSQYNAKVAQSAMVLSAVAQARQLPGHLEGRGKHPGMLLGAQ